MFRFSVMNFPLRLWGCQSFDDFVLPGTVTDLTINAAAGFRVDTTFTTLALETLTITGAGAVRISVALDADAQAVDASTTFTGVITLAVGADQAITTGSGADVIDMQGNLDRDDVIDLGDGADTLRIDVDSLTAGTADLAISNVETFRFDNTGANNGAINMDNLSSPQFASTRQPRGSAGSLPLVSSR